MENKSRIAVFYDGSCPICSKEIKFYKKIDHKNSLNCIDITKLEQNEVTPGISKEIALSRFHILNTDGKIYTGGRAFLKVWAGLPYFKYPGYILNIWPLPYFVDIFYNLFLYFRPFIQKIFRS